MDINSFILRICFPATDSYGGFDFTGTMFVNTVNDDDFVGLAFGYQSARHFYLFSWKQHDQSYWRSKPDFLSRAKQAIELKVSDDG